MASDGPDPQALKTWQDAFQYPIPTVRRVEQELRRDIASNKEKLRALVGTRYRELVGTAETIVSMNREIQNVDATLADIGQRCNPRLMEKKFTHFHQIKGDVRDKDSAKRSLSAQLALLQRCAASISQLLRRRGSLSLMAKLTVVSRLLHNTISQQKSVPPFLENLRNQIASLQHTLIRRIDKRLASATSTADEIIEALVAYCLATKSSSDDAIRRFHQVRLDHIGSQLESQDASGEHVLNALRLYVRTLQSTRVLLSRRLSDALGKLKARPILADPDIRGLDDLGLDVLGRWVAADVSNFTPWIKLSECSKSDAEKLIKQWSKQAFGRFVDGCQKALTNWLGFSSLLSLREKTVELWLSSWGSTPTHSSLQVLEGLRTVFNERLRQILSDQAKSLNTLGHTVASVLSSWDNREHMVSHSLWDHELMSLDYSNGASAFKQTIADRLLGRDEDISDVLKIYQDWLSLIEGSRQSVDELRRVRWTDILDESEDGDVDIDATATLNEDDPQLLREALESAVRTAFDDLDSSFNGIFKEFGASPQSGKAAFMLKLIRLVRRDLPTDFHDSKFVLSKDIVPQLQALLANEVLKQTQPLRLIAGSVAKAPRVPGRTLWEGDPESPVQPSPSTFKFLRRLVESMDGQGPGIWDISTINVLKGSTQTELSKTITSALEALSPSSSATDGDAVKDSSESTDADKDEDNETSEKTGQEKPESEKTSETEVQNLNDWKLQLYFDAAYLKNALASKDQESEEFKASIAKLSNEVASSPKSVKFMDHAASEYWKRTQLLLGLLAVGAEK
ncbi:hypothetical protein P170DRAFT_408663 [Aspergillus steynii IBT 23096]|uniref:Conserved oligomeric Golgi complex subunit 1 n=1 Tax=Aspergillus steynii IBT 23096 TaxID=1392250 RepID=A0A2I2G970_9EURO|nr:uncharacterized protein P170DRAFT_408663 [Aspergillus steynii IBT 23096]PLB49424.1 hypothetical protein P170DRAFT_408663 [Aspergillus steynii IBT 23096]